MLKLIAATAMMLACAIMISSAVHASSERCTLQWDKYFDSLQDYLDAKKTISTEWTELGREMTRLSRQASVSEQEFRDFGFEVIAFSDTEIDAGDAVIEMMQRTTNLLACLTGEEQ